MPKFGGRCKYCGKEYACRRRDFLCCRAAIDEIEAHLKARETISEETGTCAVPKGEGQRIAEGFELMAMSRRGLFRLASRGIAETTRRLQAVQPELTWGDSE